MTVAGWILGIREVLQVTVPEDEDKVGVQRGPVVMKSERVITDLPASEWARTLQMPFGAVELPMATGAGPCGTCMPNTRGGWWALRWSRWHLVAPLQHWYATYEEPMHFGAKSGPRGRRAAMSDLKGSRE